jgi:ABC-type molybdate transport system substrate-binding protein
MARINFIRKGLVTLGAAQGVAKRFLEFVASAEAPKVFASRGIVPVK